MKLVLVSAVALIDADGRLLLAQRPEGKSMAGLWEFPGGKVEPGETPEDALVRELREELGVDATVGAPVACVPLETPGRRLVLDVREVAFSGHPRGLEGQALAWVPLHKLADYPMPPADVPVVEELLRRQ